MNRETIAALYDVKQAMLQQQTLAMREAGARLTAIEAERDALLEHMNRPNDDDTITTAIAAQRYRVFQKKALARLAEKIIVMTRDYRKAEEELTVTFAEVRAIERLMKG